MDFKNLSSFLSYNTLYYNVLVLKSTFWELSWV